jgi:hypothetical protein
MKGFKIVLIILYVVFAAVQWNDPDPFLWIGIYGVTAVIILLTLLGWHSKVIIGVLILAGAIYSLTYIEGVLEYFKANDLGAIGDKMHYDRPYIELTREFGGLWIALGGLILVYFKK